MAPLRATVLRLAGDLVRDEMRRIGMAIAMWALAFLLVIVALGFAIGGIHAAIAAPLGAAAASFIVAGGVLVLALLLVAIAAGSLRQGRTVRREAISEFAEDHPRAASLGELAGQFGVGLFRGFTRRRKRKQQ